LVKGFVFRFWALAFFFVAAGASASERDDIRLLFEYLRNAIAVFDVDDNVLNTKGAIKILRYRFDADARMQVHDYQDPRTGLIVPITFRAVSNPRPLLIDGPKNGRIRRLQASKTAFEDWPADLRRYFYTQLLPMVPLPGLDPKLMGSRVMESTMEGRPNQFLRQIIKNARRGILFDAPMLEILRRYTATAGGARQVGFITSRRHESYDLFAGFQFLTERGIFDHVPDEALMRAVGNPNLNPQAHDPTVNLADLKTKELEKFVDLAEIRKKHVFFSDDDPANFTECLKGFCARRAKGELAPVGLLIAYTGHTPLPDLPGPVVLIPAGSNEPRYFPLETLLAAGRLLPEPKHPLPAPADCKWRIAGKTSGGLI